MTAPEFNADQPATAEEFFQALTFGRTGTGSLVKVIKMKKGRDGNQSPVETYCANIEQDGGQLGELAPTVVSEKWKGPVPAPSMTSALDRAVEWNDAFSVYYLPNSTNNPNRMVNADDEVDDFRALFIDCDNPAVSEHVLRYWQDSDFPPSAAIETTPNDNPAKAGKVQLIWLLDGVERAHRPIWQAVEKRLIDDTNEWLKKNHESLFEVVPARIDSNTGKSIPATYKLPIDPSAKNPARPMRWPGSLNHKTKPAKAGAILFLSDVRYGLDRVQKLAPVIEAPPRTPLGNKPTANKTHRFNQVVEALREAESIKHEIADAGDNKPSLEIRCPWAYNHTDPNDDSAFVFDPSDHNNHRGGFKCHHNSCEDKDFKALYSELCRNGQGVHLMGDVTNTARTTDTLLVVVGTAGATLVHNTFNFPLVALNDYNSWEDRNPTNLVLQPVPELMELLVPGLTVYVMMEEIPDEKSDTFTIARLALTMVELGIAARFVVTPLPYSEWKPGGDLRELLPKMDDATPLESAAGKYLTGETVEAFSNLRFDTTDRGVASFIITSKGKGNLLYMPGTKDFYLWTGHEWRNLGEKPKALTDEAAFAIKNRADTLWKRVEMLQDIGADDDTIERLENEALELTTLWRKLSDMLPAMRVIDTLRTRQHIHSSPSKFNTSKFTIGAPNGIIDLCTGELRKPRREDFCTRSTAVPYIPNYEPKEEGGRRIRQFLSEVMAKKHGEPCGVRNEYLQEMVGSFLFGRNVRRKLDCWGGKGLNGKSVLIKLMEGVLGSGPRGYFAAVPVGIILQGQRRESSAATPDLEICVGRRLVACVEPPQGSCFDENVIKQYVGGDTLPSRGLYQKLENYTITFNFVMAYNTFPTVTHGDEAFWERMSPLDFLCQWESPSSMFNREDRPRGDSWFIDEAFEDKDAMTYLLSWMVAGAVRFYKNDSDYTNVPPEVSKTFDKYREESNVFLAWMAECNLEFVPYDKTARTRILTSELTGSFNEWRKSGPGRTINAKTFANRFLHYNPEVGEHKVRGIMYILGIKHKDIDTSGEPKGDGTAVDDEEAEE